MNTCQLSIILQMVSDKHDIRWCRRSEVVLASILFKEKIGIFYANVSKIKVKKLKIPYGNWIHLVEFFRYYYYFIIPFIYYFYSYLFIYLLVFLFLFLFIFLFTVFFYYFIFLFIYLFTGFYLFIYMFMFAMEAMFATSC